MFSNKKEKGNYRQVSADDFSSDDDEDHDIESHSNNNNNNAPQHRAQQLMKQQDEGLEMLSQSAERLGQMSLQINDELTSQNQILDDMESDLDDANADLDLVTKKTREFIEFTGGEKNCWLIVSLAAVAVILLFLILYT